MPEQIAERTAEDMAEHMAEHIAEHIAERTAEHTAEHMAEHTADVSDRMQKVARESMLFALRRRQSSIVVECLDVSDRVQKVAVVKPGRAVEQSRGHRLACGYREHQARRHHGSSMAQYFGFKFMCGLGVL